jgi:hypothetical protein
MTSSKLPSPDRQLAIAWLGAFNPRTAQKTAPARHCRVDRNRTRCSGAGKTVLRTRGWLAESPTPRTETNPGRVGPADVWRVVPKFVDELPPALRDHLFDRLRDRKITVRTYQLKLWRSRNPRLRRAFGSSFGSFKICEESISQDILAWPPPRGQALNLSDPIRLVSSPPPDSPWPGAGPGLNSRRRSQEAAPAASPPRRRGSRRPPWLRPQASAATPPLALT